MLGSSCEGEHIGCFAFLSEIVSPHLISYILNPSTFTQNFMISFFFRDKVFCFINVPRFYYPFIHLLKDNWVGSISLLYYIKWLFFFFFFPDPPTRSFYVDSSVCPGNLYIDQVGLKLTDINVPILRR